MKLFTLPVPTKSFASAGLTPGRTIVIPLPSTGASGTMGAEKRMVLGLIADTHRHSHGQPLPDQVFAAFDGVDAILHAGDLTCLDVLDPLRAYAPVHAVAGNSDPWEVAHLLPTVLRLEFDGLVIGLTHGHLGRGAGTAARALSQFDDAQVVVFGHSHIPLVETRDGVLLVNPGSATQRRSQPQHSVARLILCDGRASAEIVRW